MPPAPTSARGRVSAAGPLGDLKRTLPTLAVATLGGWLMSLVDAPLPWFFGAMFAVAGANLAGWRISGPRGSRQLGQIFVGTAIGLYFTPTVAGIVAAHLPWMLLVGAVSIGFGALGAATVGRLARLDRATAFFGNVPGGMAEMMEFGDRYGAQPVPLALAQLTRVTIVILSIPPALTFLGQTGDDIFVPLTSAVRWPGLGLLLSGAALAAIILNRAGMPNSWMLGSALAVGIPTVFSIEVSALPRELLSVAQVLIGVALGQRFDRSAMRSAPLVILGSAGTTVFMMGTALALAALIAERTGIPIAAMIAATAPGGLAEMSLTAAVLNLGVPLVTAYHITRIVLITVLTLPAWHLVERVFPAGTSQ